LDERSLLAVMGELDTVSEFVAYLSDKEILLTSGRRVHVRREEDLLAVYLHRGREFPMDDPLTVEAGCWEALQSHPQFIARKTADVISYAWDWLIEGVAQHAIRGTLVSGSASGTEQALRVMASEPRFSRRALGQGFAEFLESSQQTPGARIMTSLGQPDTAYVILCHPRDCERAARVQELQLRCLVARVHLPERSVIVGIATEQYDASGFSFDVLCLRRPHISDEEVTMVRELQADTGYWVGTVPSQEHYDEWPDG
jgi:hypothetical protein